MVPLSGIGLNSISRVFYVNVPLCTSAGNLSVKGLKAMLMAYARVGTFSWLNFTRGGGGRCGKPDFSLACRRSFLVGFIALASHISPKLS